MKHAAKISPRLQADRRHSGEAAIFLLVLFGLLSMLGLVRADDKSSRREERQQNRAEDSGHRERRNAESISTPTIRDRSPTSMNTGTSTPLTSPSLPDASSRVPFAPQFSHHHDYLRTRTADRNPDDGGSTLLRQSRQQLDSRRITIPGDDSDRTRRGRSLSTESFTPNFKQRTPDTSKTSDVTTQNQNSLLKSEPSSPRRKTSENTDTTPRLRKPISPQPSESTEPLSKRLQRAKETDHPAEQPADKTSSTNRKTPQLTDRTAAKTSRDDLKDDSRTNKRIDRIPEAPKPNLEVAIPRDERSREKNNEKPDKQQADRVRPVLDDNLKLTPEKRLEIANEHHRDQLPNRHLKQELSRIPIEKNGKILEPNLQKLNLKTPRRQDFQTLFQSGQLLPLTNNRQTRPLLLQHQWVLAGKGDVARRMNLPQNLYLAGGWQHRKLGHVSPAYTRHCLSAWYPGPGYYPQHCWYPRWSSWVDWCSWDSVATWCDPRPIHCRPIVWNACPSWTWWNCPTWQPLPVVTCGTWIDLPQVVINDIDLQLLAVRFVDPGHIQQERGPRYRVWLRNNTPRPITQSFNVMLLTSDDSQLLQNRSEAGVRVERIDANETMTLDIRLPEEVNYSSTDDQGNPSPFQFLTIQIDSHRELADADPSNNGTTIPRGEILPVDPASFAADPPGSSVGSIVNIAGEGFGPEPGQVLVQLGEEVLQGEIEGWYDLGVRIRLPQLPLTTSTVAQLVVVRGDGAAANPITLEIAPPDTPLTN